MKRSVLLSLIIIFIVGVVLRFYQLGAIPKSLNWDEVSWGYNAYSIATTGKDEYGITMPLSFKAFGDYKQPVYVYLDALPTILFGLTGFAVRFPSAIFGSLAVLSVFLLTRELFYNDKRRDILSLLVAGLLAISPWSIQFSRVAFEANVGLFFTITGIALFLKGIRINKLWWIMFGSAVMSISCYTYHSQKLFTPLLFAVLIVSTYNFWLKKRIVLVIVLLFFLLCNCFWLLDSRTTARGRSVIFTSNQTELLADSAQKLIYDNAHGDILGKALHNRRLVYLNIYISNYLSHFNPEYLFLKGDNPRHHPPEMGDLYLVAFPFIILGMLYLWKMQKRVTVLIFAWLLLAPVASSLAVDAPNASRSMVFLPTWDIFTGLGILTFYELIRKYAKPSIIISGLSLLFLLNFIFYVHSYFLHTDLENAYYWQYGYKEAMGFTKDYQKTHQAKAIFSTNFEQPYIFYLFYAKVHPLTYINDGGSNRINDKCFSIENAYFGKCDSKITPNDLVISLGQQQNKNLSELKKILYPNQQPAVYIYKNK
ncbi:hypothetical protein BH09PAT1_BH09PAT1_6720 [soil metagenome]